MVLDTEDNKNRWQYSRAEVSWPVTLIVSRKRIQGKLENISQSGGLVYCDRLPPIKESFCMKIEAPDRPPLRVTARVVWTTINASDDGETNLGTDVQFEKISEMERVYLRDIIAEYRQRNPRRTGREKKKDQEERGSGIANDSSWSFSC